MFWLCFCTHSHFLQFSVKSQSYHLATFETGGIKFLHSSLEIIICLHSIGLIELYYSYFWVFSDLCFRMINIGLTSFYTRGILSKIRLLRKAPHISLLNLSRDVHDTSNGRYCLRDHKSWKYFFFKLLLLTMVKILQIILKGKMKF